MRNEPTVAMPTTSASVVVLAYESGLVTPRTGGALRNPPSHGPPRLRPA
jgi:hypothetical protein